MFAIGLWDRVEERLHLVRDRLGIKPLFVAALPDGLAFASEVRAFETDPSFDRALDPAAIEDVLRVGYVGAGRSIYRAVRPLSPGTHLLFAQPNASEAQHRTFWDVAEVMRTGREQPFAGDEADALDELERTLRDAVRLRMLADVPLGAFLSGGIDSSLVTALMQAQSERPVRTYSIGNERAAYDESTHAAEVARHLGTAHTAFRVSAEQALAVVPKLATMYDEPFADSSQIPTFLVCELARREVTVALSGDGGDEVFGGYNRHVFAPPIWRLASSIPSPLRAAAAGLALAPSEERWDGAFERTLRGRVRTPGAKVHKLARALRARSEAGFYDQLRSLWPPEALPLRAASSAPSSRFAVQAPSFAERMMASDLVDYLPGDILTKVDRASMAVALEARVPLLDHRVVELAWRLPHAMKIRGRTGKHLLRALLSRYVPPALFARPKMGFGIPLGEWLRGPLRSWAEDVLARPAAALGLDSGRVQATWGQHLARGGHEHRLWPVLMLSAWAAARGVR
jgi:asparagine synthase (glutamine-hydrolysing)